MRWSDMSSRSAKLWLLALIMTALGACHAAGPWVEIHGQRIGVEIADDNASRAKGLMFRDSLGKNSGMLFIFEREAPRAFWMKNTRIALDIIYMDSGFRVVGISADTPPCRSRSGRCPSYPSGAPARYVLEINAGRAAALGLETGDVLKVGNLPETIRMK